MSNSENYSYERISSNRCVSSVIKADLEGVKVYDKEMKGNFNMKKVFNCYMYEPEKEISSTSLSSESDYD